MHITRGNGIDCSGAKRLKLQKVSPTPGRPYATLKIAGLPPLIIEIWPFQAHAKGLTHGCVTRELAEPVGPPCGVDGVRGSRATRNRSDVTCRIRPPRWSSRHRRLTPA